MTEPLRERVAVNRRIGLLGIVSVAGLAALSAAAAIASLREWRPSMAQAWLIGAGLWAVLAAFIAVLVLAGSVSRIIIPPSKGFLEALAVVCAGNLFFVIFAVQFPHLAWPGSFLRGDEGAIVYTLTFVTTALLFSGVTFTRRMSPRAGIGFVATVLAGLNAAWGAILAALFVQGILFPPII